MTREIWFASDHHFGHDKCWSTFKQPDNITPLRPFTSTEQMNEVLIQRHNEVVKPEDHVYFLGDIVINKKFLPLCNRLMGHKRLVLGNHDIFPEMYAQYFDKLWGVRVLDSFVFTHIPLKEECLSRWTANVHGHLHGNVVNDPRYISVCVEHIDYRPITLGEIKERVKKNKDKFEHTGSVIVWQTGKLHHEVYGRQQQATMGYEASGPG